MKVLHTGTIETVAGGAATAVYFMLKGLNMHGCDAELFSFECNKESKVMGSDILVHYTPRPYKLKFNKLSYSNKYKRDLLRLGDYDIYHANGIWLYDTYAVADISRKLNKPYIITPHGMLYPQDIEKSNAKFKKLCLNIRLLNDLNKASCIQTTCIQEMIHCRNIGITSPIAVIPNPIEIKKYESNKNNNQDFVLGYLGRLSPRKNVEGLIYSWSKLKEKCEVNNILKERFNKSQLLIIGSGDCSYERFLKNEVERLKLKNVKFTGFLNGIEKENAIRNISVLAMPSEFENFGMVIAEGLIRGIPCIATQGAPWKDLNTYNCGWWIPYQQKEIDLVVEKAFNTSAKELSDMGNRGKELINQRYSIEIVTEKVVNMYKWIVGEIPKPEYIYTL